MEEVNVVTLSLPSTVHLVYGERYWSKWYRAVVDASVTSHYSRRSEVVDDGWRSLVFQRTDSPFPSSKKGYYGNLYHVKARTTYVGSNPNDKLNLIYQQNWLEPDTRASKEPKSFYQYVQRLDDNHLIYAQNWSVFVSPPITYDYYTVEGSFTLYEFSDKGYYTYSGDGFITHASSARPFAWSSTKDVRSLTVQDWIDISQRKSKLIKYQRLIIQEGTISTLTLGMVKDRTALLMQNYPDADIGWKAYSNFRIVNAPLTRELIDTATDLAGLVGNGGGRELLKNLEHSLGSPSNLIPSLKAIFRDLPEGVAKTLPDLTNLTRDSLRSLASTYLFSTFGIKLPIRTINDWAKDSVYRDAIGSYGFLAAPNSGRVLAKAEVTMDVDDTGALTLGYGFPEKRKYKSQLQQALGDSALRATLVQSVGDISCKFGINIGYSIGDNLIDYYNAFCRAGLLLSVSDAWDLIPLSFVADWVTGAVRQLSSWIDNSRYYVTLPVTYVGRSLKYTLEIPAMDHNGNEFVTECTVYRRWYNNHKPERVHLTDIYRYSGDVWDGSFSWSTSGLTSAALGIMFLS